MITELLDAVIDEVNCNGAYEITDFQLGSEPMKMFITECLANMGIPIDANITSVNKYKSIPIKLHHNNNAVMYSISIK